MRQYRRAPRPNRNWLYKGFLITKLGNQYRVTDIMGSVLTSVENVKAAQIYIDAIFRKRFSAKRVNPADMKFIHERLRSPKSLKQSGLTKYRSKVTPSGDVIRIAFPPGKKRKGSGKVQAILHKKNPKIELKVGDIVKTNTRLGTVKIISHDPDSKFWLVESPHQFGLNYITLDEIVGRYVKNPHKGPRFRSRMWQWLMDNEELLRRTGNSSLFDHYRIRGKKAFTIEEAYVIYRIKNDYETGRFHPELLNPLTSREVSNIRKESSVHRAIKGSHIKTAYYQGMANGMDDIAEQYAMNPPVEIYSEIKEIIARKGPGHRCDAACKRANHTYRHKFSKKAGVFGHPDGTISIQ